MDTVAPVESLLRGKRGRQDDQGDASSPPSKRPRAAPDLEALFAEALRCAAQAGYIEDIIPAASICKAYYNDQSLWGLISRFRARHTVDLGGQGHVPERQGRTFYSYRTPLMAAARSNRVERTELLLGCWGSLPASASSSSSSSPSEPSASTSTSTLIMRSCVDSADIHGKTALHWACEAGNIEIIRLLLTKGRADPNKRTVEGKTALHLSCARGDAAAVALLLEPRTHGICTDVAISDQLGRTPWDACAERAAKLTRSEKDRTARRASADIFLLLLKAGATATDPLALFTWACQEKNETLANALIDAGQVTCNRTFKEPRRAASDKGGQVTSAAGGAGGGAAASASVADSKASQAQGELFPLYRPGPNEWPLLIACDNQLTAIALRLLDDEDADPNFGTGCPMMPLHVAALHGIDVLVRRLVEKGANINALSHLSDEFCSPLYFAAKGGQRLTVELLLSLGADPNACGFSGMLPFEAACWHAQDEGLARHLLEHGTDLWNPGLHEDDNECRKTPLDGVAAMGFTDLARWMLDKGCPFDLHPLQGAHGCRTPLLYACKNGHADMAILLLEQGATPNVGRYEYFGPNTSPLEYACRKFAVPGMMKAIRLLLEKGAEQVPRVDEPEDSYRSSSPPKRLRCKKLRDSCLQFAAKSGSEELVSLLLQHDDSQINHQGKKRKTALWRACKRGDAGIVRLLLRNGAQSFVCDAKGRSPLQVAARAGHLEVVKALLEPQQQPPRSQALLFPVNHFYRIPFTVKSFEEQVFVQRYSGTALHIALAAFYDEDNEENDADDDNDAATAKVSRARRLGVIDLLFEVATTSACARVPDGFFRSLVLPAIKAGLDDLLFKILAAGTNSRPSAEEDENGPVEFLALTCAVATNNEPLALSLIDFGSNTTIMCVPSHSGASAFALARPAGDDPSGLVAEAQALFLEACKHGLVSLVKALLARGFRPDMVDPGDKKSALHLACASGSLELLSLLIASDPKCVELRDKQGYRPLHDASRPGHAGIIRLLLSEGKANPNPGSVDGWSPLALALRCGENAEASVLALLGENSSDRNALNPHSSALSLPATLSKAAFGKISEADLSCMFKPLIHVAVSKGMVYVVTRLLDLGVPVDCTDHTDMTPLMAASKAGHLQVAEGLLARGADANATDARGYSPLHFAAGSGSTDLATVLLAAGASIDSRNDEGQTPLLAACEMGHFATAIALVKAGANIAAQDFSGATPLKYACQRRDAALLAALLDAGVVAKAPRAIIEGCASQVRAPVSRDDATKPVLPVLIRLYDEAGIQTGLNALQAAVELGDEESALRLHRRGAPFRDRAHGVLIKAVKAKMTRLALTILASFKGIPPLACLEDACRHGMASVVERLVSLKVRASGTSLEASAVSGVPSLYPAVRKMLGQSSYYADKRFEIALYSAMLNGHVQIALMILAEPNIATKCDLNAMQGPARDDTLVHLAVKSGMHSVLERLLEVGASPNTVDNGLPHPLILACERLDVKAARLLLAKGANADAVGPAGRRPLHLLANRKYQNAGSAEIAALLLKAGAQVNMKDAEGAAPLWMAAMGGHYHLAALLLKAGANPDIEHPRCEPDTPLITALQKWREDLVALMLHFGASTRRQERNYNPFDNVCSTGSPASIELMIKAGALLVDPEEKESAIRGACSVAGRNQPERVAMLLRCGADPHETDSGGRTLMDAVRSELNEMGTSHPISTAATVKLLLAAGAKERPADTRPEGKDEKPVGAPAVDVASEE